MLDPKLPAEWYKGQQRHRTTISSWSNKNGSLKLQVAVLLETNEIHYEIRYNGRLVESCRSIKCATREYNHVVEKLLRKLQ